MKNQKSALRNYLFYGLTLVLVTVFIFLAVQNKKKEKEQINQGKEEVQGFNPTPIRSLAPQDLELESNLIPLSLNNRDGQQPLFRYRIGIQNSGHVTYQEILLKVEYLDAGGKALGSGSCPIVQQIPPGHTFLSVEIPFDTIPAEAVACRFSVIYADMKPNEKKQAAGEVSDLAHPFSGRIRTRLT